MDFEHLYLTTYPKVMPTPAGGVVARRRRRRRRGDLPHAWRQADIPRGAELGWLIGVTRRVLANARRSERRVGALRTLLGVQPRVDAPDPVESIADAALRAALLELSPLDREAFALTAWFDLSGADAARALGITHAAYRMRMTRARRRLRTALDATSTVEHPQWT